MKQSKFSFLSAAAIITLLVMALGSFSQPVMAADSDPNKPGDIPTIKTQTVHDQTNEKTAKDKTAFGGDVFGLGWYERPFDQNMGYLPFMDIAKILMNREDPNWVYVQMFMVNPLSEGDASKPLYGIEMDTDLDNRGEFILLASTPKGTEWSTEGVMIMSNSDNNMGGIKPVLPDTKLSDAKGYDKEVFNSGKGDDPNLAWARISPKDPKCIQFAFKSSFIGGAKGKFIWMPWALVGVQDLTKFEFNDKFTREEAGSPLKSDGATYPLKSLWGVDNTARIPSGFVPTGNMPGLAEPFQIKP
ncbi:hypothetical protein [Leptolinea tardivitalis]|uniref:Carbohydrate-binding domain-containing protein n=1 Tax=Leptolinea tardivitalis TaxID=229920 RepID=A0A0N8GME5_9CHLR|nr:hypothetical protein [Leptolinea tardivitalis]KPL75074.1 hypothetical protein ADM99_00130 [Leptolinea tardivitalis]GAP20461.1 hypothetical protein LTAR_00651 [Leptolinea tardivitalis]